MQITSFHFSLTVTTPQALIDGANIWTGKVYEKKRGDSRLTSPTTLTPRFIDFFTNFEKKNRLFWSLSVSRLWGGARVVQWWKHSPPTNVVWVQIRVLTPYVSWVCSWFSPLPWVVFFGHSGFPLASKPNISTPNWTRNARPRISPLMCYLSIFIYFINFINIIKGHLKEFSLLRGAGMLLV